MRHQKKGHKLERSPAHRKRTLQAMSRALIEKKRIQTTVPKAKALRPFVEPLITRAKEDTTHNRRQVFRHLQDKGAVRELFDEVAVEVGDRPGGYTRVIKLGRRTGDGAERAMIELVDYNDVQPRTGSDRKRTRRGGGSSSRSRSTPAGPQPGSAEPPQQEEPDADEATTAEGDAQPHGAGQEGSSGAPETSTTETTDQQESLGGEEKAAVEAPVPEEQKEPVPDRTATKDEAAAADEVADTGPEAEEPPTGEEDTDGDEPEDEAKS
ncbi:MAG: 50S ribosomal protein L17 [Bacteroidetes bacterium QH_8_67_23]|nr:MAG: 50S ribosomal protein L17 [Bacteroidetes bacterium QH_8_67_23]